MAQLISRPTVSLHIVLQLDEKEAGALAAMAAYSTEDFLDVFYTRIGESALKPYEAGLRSLFESVRQIIPEQLGKAKTARQLFKDAGEVTIKPQ